MGDYQCILDFDVYRITDIEEMDDTGYEDCFFGEGGCMSC